LPRVQLRTRAGRRPLTGNRQDNDAKSFVLETGGRAVLAFSARSMAHAKDLCSQHWFVKELASYRSYGRPIWDGAAELRMRCASASEAAELEIATAGERARREYEGYVFVFFVAVDADLQ
jgi:hypothetical protein